MIEPRLRRLLRLYSVLELRGGLATADAAALLGIDRETARRDLCALVEATDEFAFEGVGRGRRVRRRRARGLAVTFGERLALHFGRQLMEFLGGTTLPGWLDELSDKLEPATDQRTRRDADHLRRRFRFVTEPYRSYDAHDDVVNEVITALLNNVELAVEYDGARTYPRLRPYTLVVYRRALYLIAHVVGRPGTLTLAVDRIRSAQRSKTEFRMPAAYDPDLALRDRFGIWASPPPSTVRLRFAAERADLVRARRWHPSARLEPVPDGRLDLVLEAGGQELVRAVLEWGPMCEVIEPAWLREEVIAELDAARAVYR